MAKQYLNHRLTPIDTDPEIKICVHQCPSVVKKKENRTDSDVNKTILLEQTKLTELNQTRHPQTNLTPTAIPV